MNDDGYTINNEKNRAIAIIIRNGKLLLIHRQKPGRDYSVLPAGGIDREENFEETCIREVKEETGLDVLALLLVSRYITLEKEENYYVTKVTQAEPVIGRADAERQSPEDSYHFCGWKQPNWKASIFSLEPLARSAWKFCKNKKGGFCPRLRLG